MPSGDEFLDSLLSGLPTKEEEEEQAIAVMDGEAPDVDGIANLTEDEIDKILSVKSDSNRSRSAFDDYSDDGGDVLDLLEDTEDGDLQEIQDLLGKSDRNEAITSGEDEEGDNPADRLLADIENAGGDVTLNGKDKKEQRALRKAQRKEEKAAKRAAKKAAKQKGRKKQKGESAQGLEEGASFDRDMLDDIVSGAGKVGRGKGKPAGQASELEVKEVDLEEAEGIVPDIGAEFAALDMDEVDALIPDITEKKDGEKKEKKGLFSKAVSFLLEEEEEEEEPENENIKLSDENQQILDELDKGKGKAKKGKKKDKGKKKAKKKETKPKKAKPPKKKKEKKPKEEDTTPPGKRLTFKKMLPVLLLGVTVGAVIFILVNISSDYLDKQTAETAFENGDYDTCYMNLYGKDRNEAQEAMYGKSESILYIRMWFREYEMFAEEGLETQALDSLIQTVKDYQDLYGYASQWDAVPEISEIYSNILNILSTKYFITEEDALEIAAVTSDIEYTRIVTALAEGRSYGSWGRPAPQPEEEEELELPDVLPEEEEMEQGEFVDNQQGGY